jgi:hypothetical protein
MSFIEIVMTPSFSLIDRWMTTRARTGRFDTPYALPISGRPKAGLLQRLVGSTISKAFQQRIVELLGGELPQLFLQRHALDLRGDLVPRLPHHRHCVELLLRLTHLTIPLVAFESQSSGNHGGGSRSLDRETGQNQDTLPFDEALH